MHFTLFYNNSSLLAFTLNVSSEPLNQSSGILLFAFNGFVNNSSREPRLGSDPLVHLERFNPFYLTRKLNRTIYEFLLPSHSPSFKAETEDPIETKTIKNALKCIMNLQSLILTPIIVVYCQLWINKLFQRETCVLMQH